MLTGAGKRLLLRTPPPDQSGPCRHQVALSFVSKANGRSESLQQIAAIEESASGKRVKFACQTTTLQAGGGKRGNEREKSIERLTATSNNQIANFHIASGGLFEKARPTLGKAHKRANTFVLSANTCRQRLKQPESSAQIVASSQTDCNT